MPEAIVNVTLPKPAGYFTVNEKQQWVESGDPADAALFDANQMRDQMVPLETVRQAVRDYHLALDTRQNGNTAQNKAFEAICGALGMHWEQGEEAARRARSTSDAAMPA